MKDKREVDNHDVDAYDFVVESQFLVNEKHQILLALAVTRFFPDDLVQDSGNGCIQALLTFPGAPGFWKCKWRPSLG